MPPFGTRPSILVAVVVTATIIVSSPSVGRGSTAVSASVPFPLVPILFFVVGSVIIVAHLAVSSHVVLVNAPAFLRVTVGVTVRKEGHRLVE